MRLFRRGLEFYFEYSNKYRRYLLRNKKLEHIVCYLRAFNDIHFTNNYINENNKEIHFRGPTMQYNINK